MDGMDGMDSVDAIFYLVHGVGCDDFRRTDLLTAQITAQITAQACAVLLVASVADPEWAGGFIGLDQ